MRACGASLSPICALLAQPPRLLVASWAPPPMQALRPGPCSPSTPDSSYWACPATHHGREKGANTHPSLYPAWLPSRVKCKWEVTKGCCLWLSRAPSLRPRGHALFRLCARPWPTAWRDPTTERSWRGPSTTTPPPCPLPQGSASQCPSRKFVLPPRATWPWPGNIPDCDFRPALSHDCYAMETPPSAPLPAPPQGHFPCNLPAPGIRVIPTLARAWVGPLFSLPPSLLCPSHSPEG